MHQIDNVLISDEVWETRFTCDLQQCGGICCEIGDLGAPVSQKEVDTIKANLDNVKPYLKRRNLDYLNSGIAETFEGSLHIREIGKNSPCPLAFRDSNNVVLCSLHAYALENKKRLLDVKPLWCTLFPLIIKKTEAGWILNQQIPDFCRSSDNRTPIIIAFKDTLKEFFGEEWIEKVKAKYAEEGVEF